MRNLKLKIKNLYHWCTKTRIRKVLSSVLAVLIFLTSIRYLFIKPKEVKAADVYLGFDEGYGTSSAVNDANGTISAGSITGATWKSEEFCKVGKCLFFDGSGDYVSFADNANLDFAGSDSGTFEGWFRHSPITPSMDVNHETGDTSQYSSVTNPDSDLTVSSTAAMNNTNYGLAVLIDDTASVYGQKDLGSQDTSGTVRFGFWLDPNTLSFSSPDEFTVANIYRTVNGTSLGYLSFGWSGSDYRVRADINDDSSVNHFTSYYTITDAPHYFEVEMKKGSGTGSLRLWIDGDFKEVVTAISNGTIWTGFQSIRFGAVSGVDATTSGTFYVDDLLVHTGSQQAVLAKYNPSTGTDGGYKVYMENDGDITCGIDDENTYFPSDSASSYTNNYDDGKWHQFACVKNGSTSLSLYLDGNLIASDSAITSLTLANTDSFYVGIDGDASSNSFQGFIDEIKVYRSARSASEIKADFAGQTPSRGTSASFGPDQSYLSNGLVGYWKMDESSWATTCSGTPISDSSGNGNNANACPSGSAPAVAVGKFGNGGSFDGTNDYVDAGSGLSLNPTDAITLTGWVKLNNTTGIKGIISKNWSSYSLEVNANQVFVRYRDENANLYEQYSTATLSSSTWYHLATTIDSKSKKIVIYINGNQDSAFSFQGNSIYSTPSQILHFGANGSGATTQEFFNGTMDEIRVYNRALSSAEIQKLYNWAPGPVGYWKFDENVSGDSKTLYDSSGYGHNATTHFGANSTGMNCSVNGKFGQGCKFDGSDDYVQVADNSDFLLDDTNNFSVSLWLNSNDWGAATRGLIGKRDAFATQDWLLTYNTGGNDIAMTLGESGASFIEDGAAVSTKVWHFVSVTKNGTAYKFYVDGVLISTQTSAQTWTNSDNITIGNAEPNGSSYVFDGTIDDVKIYNYDRTATQIIEDMNGGHPAPGSPIGSAIGYWNFDEGYSTTAHNTGSLGTSADGTFSGTPNPTWTNNSKFGKAVNFVTSGDNSITLTNSVSAKNLSEYTISAWIKLNSLPTATNNYDIWAEPVTDTVNSVRAQIHVGNSYSGCGTNVIGLAFRTGTSASTRYDVCGTTTLTTGTWYNVVGVFNSNTDIHKVYLNGKEDGTLSQAVSAVDNTNPNVVPRIGIYANGNSDFDGTIDEVSFYNSALAPDQIKMLYNQGSMAVMGATSTDSSGTATWSDTNAYCPPGQGSTCTEPVSRWTFDENNGQTLYDLGTGKKDAVRGTTASSEAIDPNWIPGKKGGALDFNGSSQYATAASLPQIANSFTAETWIYPRSFPGVGSYITFLNNGAFYFELTGTDEMDCGGFPGEHDTTTANISTNAWHHVACVFDNTGNTLKMYLDGKEVYSNTETGVPGAGTSTFYIGACGGCGPGQYLNGMMDDVRMYDYARSAAQIAWDYNRGGPIAWWQMDESSWGTPDCSATVVKDASGNGLHGKACPASTGPTGGSTGKISNAGTFDGSNDRIDISDYDITGQISITAWIKPTATNNNFGIISKRTAVEANGDWSFRLSNSGNGKLEWITWDGTGASDLTNSNTTINTTDWQHVAVTYDTSTNTTKFYLNGKPDGTDSSHFYGLVDNPEIIQIGFDGQAAYFPGLIDDVRVYNYVLTNQQVNVIMNDSSAVKFWQ